VITVTAECTLCSAKLRLLVKLAPPDRDYNILPDAADVVRQLIGFGWTLPGPVCDAHGAREAVEGRS
jgi:hypothetical protein